MHEILFFQRVCEFVDAKMKRKQGNISDTSEIEYVVMETTASSGTYVEFMPQIWLIPPKNKQLQHKERDNVKFLFPRRLPQQTKDAFIKFVKQAKFNCIPGERNDNWEVRDGRILRMGIGMSFEVMYSIEVVNSKILFLS